MDRVSREVRSRNMAAVRSKGNRSTEVTLGRLLWASGLRGYRKHWAVDGRPDFAWPSLRVAVFVDGCFWHGCTRHSSMPRSNRPFWAKKLAANKARDRLVNRTLRRAGWRVVRIWEHDLTRRASACVTR